MLLVTDINHTLTRPRGGKIFSTPNDDPDNQDIEIIPGIPEALQRFKNAGYQIHGISNQKGVADGYKSLQQAEAEMRATLQLLPQIDSILFCPDSGDTCYRLYQLRPDHLYDISNKYPHQNLKGTYRKPDTGMLRHILLSTEILPEETIYAGDRPEDEEAARRAGILYLTEKQLLNYKERKKLTK